MSDFVKNVPTEGKALIANGLNLITGGTGIADLTLRAPFPGERCVIRLVSITSGSVVVTCATTFDGTNNTATLDAAQEALHLVYDGKNWAIEANIGSVSLS